MDRIERMVRLPEGRRPSEYTRHYAASADGQTILAIYVSGRDHRSWEALSRLPRIMDGGCGVVTIRFDVARDLVDSVDCNGLA